jgi:hypothetical protein
VTLERAASELACEQSELVNALAWASVRKIDVGNRVAGLAHSIPVPRSAFKGEYLKVKRYLDDWRNK